MKTLKELCVRVHFGVFSMTALSEYPLDVLRRNALSQRSQGRGCKEVPDRFLTLSVQAAERMWGDSGKLQDFSIKNLANYPNTRYSNKMRLKHSSQEVAWQA